MSAIHASVPMATTAGNMMVGAAPNLSALGKALGETTISSPSADDPASPASLSMAPVAVATSTAAAAAALAVTKKSPKKRERTDSMKKMMPAPAAQRAKSSYDGLVGDTGDHDDHDDDDDDDDAYDDDGDDDDNEGDGDDDADGDDGYSDASSSTADPNGIKLPVKDRTGSAIAGVSRVTLISNAVKTAPPAKEKSNPRRWSKAEDESLRLAVERSGERNWKAIAEQVPGRNHTQCLQRWTKVLKPGLIKGHWDPEEDAKLRDLVAEGKRNWGQVASLIPGRTSKQCRERWCNHLDPNINKGLYTEDEDRIIMEMQAKLGNRWSIIAQHLKGRTEDAVKIRWKSLMRGKKAAGKELQQQQQAAGGPSTASAAEFMAAASFASAATTAQPPVTTVTTNPSLQADDRSRAKPARTPTKQKTRAASPVAKPLEPIAFKPEAASNPPPPTMQQQQHQQQQMQQMQQMQPPQPMHRPPSASGVGIDSSGRNSIDSTHVAASINSYMQNVNDLVAASIHNFRLSQNFSPGMQVGPATSGSSAPPTSSTSSAMPSHMMGSSHPSMMSQSTISPMNQPVYSMPPQQGYHGMPQQHRPYAVPTSYQMQANMNLPPNYVLPTSGMQQPAPGQHFPVSMAQSNAHMAMSMGAYGHYSAPMMNDGRGMAMPPHHTQGYPASSAAMGGSVGITYHNGVPMMSQSYAMHQGLTIPPPHPSLSGQQQEPLAPVSAPPPSLSAASKLATPREEWGSSQTPRSHLIMTEGHASAYELFHQQRLRLMLKERDKGMSLTSAPSPGQAMLTKELKANKERQKRQEMMQQGWKSAVDAMMSLTSDSPSLEDSDNLMEKVVGLSALDPVDDELMGGDVDINLPPDDSIVEGEEVIL